MLSRRAREIVVVASLLALPLLFLRANLKSPSELNVFDRFLVRVSAPLQSLFGAIARSVGGAFGRYVHLVGVEGERERLAEENARLKAELDQARHAAQRTAQLEKLLGMKTRTKVPSIAARVVGAESSPFFRVVRIRLELGGRDDGSDAEVKPGMPVVAADGVVGRVQRVAGSFADVLLAVDPKCAIDVVDPRTGARGILHGVASDNQYRGRIEYLLKQDEVAAGDAIVTSGIGGPFPKDLPIGKVVGAGKREVGLYQEAVVEPAVDFNRLEHVLVLLSMPPETIPAPAGTKK